MRPPHTPPASLALRTGAACLALLAACAPPKEAPTPFDDVDIREPQPCVSTMWAFDQDSDGHGDPNLRRSACEQLDGYVALADDCNDLDATTYPGAQEICDGVDHDCDGAINEDDAEGSTPWFIDLDGDGYGAGEPLESLCNGPPGTVRNKIDCDDTNALVSPRAAEICNEIDDNCDALVDDADPLVTGETAWFLDDDGDGRGDQNTPPVWACEPVEGLITDGSDCDDDDPTRPTAFYADDDGDGWGGPDEIAFTCVQPAGASSVPGDCDDADPESLPGGTDLDVDGADQDCDGEDGVVLPVSGSTLTSSDALLRPGAALATGADLTGDGVSDLVVASLTDDTTTPAFSVLARDYADGSYVQSAAITVSGAPGPAHLLLATLGDATGDGAADLVVAQDAGEGFKDGRVWLHAGPLGASASADNATLLIDGDVPGGLLGAALGAPADLDEDGGIDLPIGQPGVDLVLLAPGAGSGAMASTSLLRVWGETPGGRFGAALLSDTDWDGDGAADLLVSAPDTNPGECTGVLYRFQAPVAGSSADATAALSCVPGEVHAATTLAPAGDLDDDGLPDLLIASADGRLRAVLGPLYASDLDTAAWWSFRLPGAPAGLLGGLDVDGDDRVDLVAADDTASLYVFRGPAGGTGAAAVRVQLDPSDDPSLLPLGGAGSEFFIGDANAPTATGAGQVRRLDGTVWPW